MKNGLKGTRMPAKKRVLFKKLLSAIISEVQNSCKGNKESSLSIPQSDSTNADISPDTAFVKTKKLTVGSTIRSVKIQTVFKLGQFLH